MPEKSGVTIKMTMNIDIESIVLLSLVLQDSPKDRQLILCVFARSNSVPTRIRFNPNTDYPTFYGYTNSRIPLYLMGKGVISNVPREGYAKRIISSHYLSYAETIINRAKNWDIHQKLMSVSKFITLDNKTSYKDAEVFLVFRDKASDYIKGYATSHKEEVSSFLGTELSSKVFKTKTDELNPLASKNPQRKLSKRELRKKINNIIKTRKFGKKETEFLKLLAKDFEPKTIEEISTEVSTKDCKHLKGRVQKKINGTGFCVKTTKTSGWGGKSYYQLEYLPTSDNQ